MRAPPWYIAAEVSHQFSDVSEKLSPPSSHLISTPPLASGELFASHGRTDLKEIAVYQSAVQMPMPCCPTIKLRCEAAGGVEIVQKHWKLQS